MENNINNEYLQQNLTLPHDVIQLPSGGIFYKNNKKTIKVGYLTAYDENIIMGGGDFVTSLLRNKIYEHDIKVEDLLEGDIEAILIFLRNTSFGPELTLNLKDPVTGKEFQSKVILDSLRIKKGQSPNSDGTFSLKLPKSETDIKVKPLTYGQIKELERLIESYPSGRTAPKITMKLQRQIVEVNGDTTPLAISQFAEQMPIFDSKYIKKFLDENEPRLDMTKEIIAPSGEKLNVNLGFGADFFRPFFGL